MPDPDGVMTLSELTDRATQISRLQDELNRMAEERLVKLLRLQFPEAKGARLEPYDEYPFYAIVSVWDGWNEEGRHVCGHIIPLNRGYWDLLEEIDQVAGFISCEDNTISFLDVRV